MKWNKPNKEAFKLKILKLKVSARINRNKIIAVLALSLVAAVIGVSIYQDTKAKSGIEELVFDYINEQVGAGGLALITPGQIEEIAETVSVTLEERVAGGEDLANTEEIKTLIKDELIKENTYMTAGDIDVLLKDFDKFVQNDYMAYINDLQKQQNILAYDLANTNSSLQTKADNGDIYRLDDMDDTLHQADKDLTDRINSLDNKLGADNDELTDKWDQLTQDTNNKLDSAQYDLLAKLEELKKQLETAGLSTDDKILLVTNTLNDQISGINQMLADMRLEYKNSIATTKKEFEIMLKDQDQISNEKIDQINGWIANIRDDLMAVTTKASENETSIAGLSSMVSECFQLVSSGKELLASTLTDKGVSTKLDADFAVINSNIVELYTKAFAAGVDSVSGITADVEYEYHHHIDESGNTTNDTDNNDQVANSAGCYTKPVYHQHTTACYGKCNRDGKYLRKEHPYHEAYYSYYFECPVHGEFCNQYITDQEPSGRCTATEIKCNRGNEIVAYTCGCGYIDGQIISATVNFLRPIAISKKEDDMIPENLVLEELEETEDICHLESEEIETETDLNIDEEISEDTEEESESVFESLEGTEELKQESSAESEERMEEESGTIS